MWVKLAIWLHAMAAWPEVFSREDVFSLKGGDDGIAATGVYFNNHILVVRVRCRIILQHFQPPRTGQCGEVIAIVPTICLDEGTHCFEVDQAHCCVYLRHFAVCAWMYNRVVASKTEITHQANIFG